MSILKRVTLNGVRKIMKPIPVIGAVVVLATAIPVIRRKGMIRGCLDVTLDMLPVVGAAKGALEIFTGDLIPDRSITHHPIERVWRRSSLLRNVTGRLKSAA